MARDMDEGEVEAIFPEVEAIIPEVDQCTLNPGATPEMDSITWAAAVEWVSSIGPCLTTMILTIIMK